MSEIYLPPSARAEVEREQRQMVDELYDVVSKLDHFNRELYQIDPHLKVMLAKPTTTVMGLKPNYYHLVRMRPGHAAWIKPVEGPNGEWRDLDSSVFDLVAEDDLWNDRSQREQRQKARKADEARKRQRDRESADRVAEFNDRLYHAQNASVRVPKAIV